MDGKTFLSNQFKPIELLRYAGLFTWLCASVPLFLLPFIGIEPLEREHYVGWWVLHLVFGLTYWNQVRDLPIRSPVWHRLLIALVMTLCALGVSVMAQSGLGGILLLVIAGLLPWMLGTVAAMSWLLVQNILYYQPTHGGHDSQHPG